MKTSKAKSFYWLNRDLAMAGPYLCLVRNKKDWLAAFAHCNCEPHSSWTDKRGATCHHLENKDGNWVCIVRLCTDPEDTGIEIACLLVHEAVHVVQAHFENMKERTPASEQQAYAIQHASQILMQEYLRQITLEQA